MTDEFEYLEEAFEERGWDCEVEIDEDEGCARFCVCKGDVSTEFEARASGIWNPMTRHQSRVTVEVDGARLSHGFGLKRPGKAIFGRAYEDFCMTGFNREAGDDPADYSRKISARRIVRSVVGAFKPARPDGS